MNISTQIFSNFRVVHDKSNMCQTRHKIGWLQAIHIL